jgi:MFS family permease
MPSRFYYGYVMVGIAFLIMLISWGLYITYGVFFDSMLNQFGWTRAAISGAYSLSSIISGVLGIAVGWLTDRFGPRLIVTVAGVCLGLGYLLMSFVNSVWELYFFYGIVVGIGMAGLWVPLVSPIVRWFTDKRSLMTGIIISGLTVGQLIGPVVISRLIAAYEWRQSYFILGIAAMVLIAVLAQFMKRDPVQTRQLVGKTDERAKPVAKSSPDQDFSLKEAAHTLQFWLVAIIFFCVGFAAFSITVHIVPHATNLGISEVAAANILAINGGIGIIGNFVMGGILGDKIGNRKAFIIGLFLMAAALFWLVPARELWVLYVFALVFGIGIGGVGTSESPLLARLFGLTSHGLIYAVLGLGWTTGGAVGPIVTGYLCDINGNYQLAFLISGIVAALGLLLIIILRPARKRGLGL